MERRYYSTRANISSPIQTLLSVREFHPVGILSDVRGLYRRYGISPSPKILLFYSFAKIGCTGVHPIFYKSNY